MRRLVVIVLAMLAAAPAFAADPPKTEEGKTFYAVGLNIARDLAVFDLSPSEFEAVKQGLSDGFNGTPAVEIGEYSKKVQEMAQERRKRLGKRAAEADKRFRASASRPANRDALADPASDGRRSPPFHRS